MAKRDEPIADPTPQPFSGMTPDALMAMFLELQQRQIALQELQAKATQLQEERTRPKDNPNYRASSIFLKPEGEGRPWTEDLKCDIFFGPIKLNKTPLTEGEVAVLNRLQPVEKARLTKTDRSVVYVSVVPTFNEVTNALEKLEIRLPMKRDDNPQHYPPLDEIAAQLAAQAPQPVGAAA